jgi:hypothetical protein
MPADKYVYLCDECACGVANDDWSHLDFYHDQEAADQQMASITGSLELFGHLTPVDIDTSDVGYFNCALCSAIQCGDPAVHLCQ